MRVHAIPLAVVVLAAVPAIAHIELDEPQVRYSNVPSEQNKSCPCGDTSVFAGRENATCALQTSDANRDAGRVTTYRAGETITVRWLETVGHTGRHRIAFDPDGADLADFNANILADVADPSGNAGNIGDLNHWEQQVTLPTTPCDNCTLQLIQVMNGNTTDAVLDPTGSNTYFQCADLILLPAEGEGEGEGKPLGDNPPGCTSTASASLTGSFAVLALLIRRASRRTAR